MAAEYAEFGFIPDEQSNSYEDLGFVAEEMPVKKGRPQRVEEFGTAGDWAKNELGLLSDAVQGSYRGLKRGVERAGGGLNQLVLPVIDKAFGTGLATKDKAYQQAEDERFAREFPDAGLAAFAGEVLPMAMPLGAGFNLASKVPGMAKFAAAAPRTAQVAQSIPAGGIYGAMTYDPTYEKPIANKALEGAILGGATMGGIQGISAAENALMKLPAKKFGNISPAEMQAAIETHRGLKTNIGDIIDSPTLKHLRENYLEAVPFSGVAQNQINTSKQLTREAEDILNKLKPKEMPENFGKDIQNILISQETAKRNAINAEANQILEKIKPRENYEDLQKSIQEHLLNKKKEIGKIKTSNYQEANQFADEIGAKVNPEKFVQQVNNEKGRLDSLLIPSAQKKELEDILNMASKFKEYNLNSNLGYTPPGESFKKTYLTKAALNDVYEDALKNNDIIKLGVINRLRGALKEDVSKAVEKSGSPELQNKFKKAEDYYVNNYLPFKDEDILKFTNRNKDTDQLISTFFKTGSEDRPNQLAKLTELLPEDMNQAIAHRYLSGAYRDKQLGKNELDPIEFSRLYNSLGEKTRNKLFPTIQEDMQKYSKNIERDIINTDKDIAKFTEPNAKSDEIESYFIRAGKDDRAGLLDKLMSKLPEDMNKTLAYRHLAKAYRDKKFGKDDLDAIQLSKLYNSLGERTRKRLFPYKDIQEDMKRLSERLEKNQEAMNAMYNPKTGQRLKEMTGLAATFASGGIAPLAANLTERALTSEKIRELYLKSLMRARASQ